MLLSGGPLGGLLPSVVAQLWTPFDEPSLVGYLDAFDSTYIAESGGLADSWNDPVSGASFVAVDPNNKPVRGAGFVGFTGFTEMVGATRFGLPADPALTIVSVLTPRTLLPDRRLISIGLASDIATPGSIALTTTPDQMSWRHDNGFALFANGGSSVKTLYTGHRSPGAYSTGQGRKNGIALAQDNATGGPPTVTTASTVLGRSTFEGDVSGILVFSSNTPAVIEKAEGWAARRWGTLATLDASHPYKNSPPPL